MEGFELGIGMPVRSIQTYLRKIGQYYKNIPLVIPDGIFGLQTRDAVIGFQNVYGLEPTGEIDDITWNRIIEVFDEIERALREPVPVKIYPRAYTVINPGDVSEHLYVLQAMMKNIAAKFDNLDDVDVTGVHDNKSVNAVQKLQYISGLNPTGAIDRYFFDMLAGLYDMHVSRNRLNRQHK